MGASAKAGGYCKLDRVLDAYYSNKKHKESFPAIPKELITKNCSECGKFTC